MSIPVALKGRNIIPMKKNSKIPAVSWKDYQSKKYPLGSWDGNFAVVCGAISNNLVVVDFDDLQLYNKFASKIDTFTVKTPNGVHVYFKTNKTIPKQQSIFSLPVDIQGEGSLIIIPPSVIEGKAYKIIKNSPIAGEKEFIYLMTNLKNSVMERPQSVNDFKNKIDINKVISQYVKPSRKGKGYWQGQCPFHNDEDPSFTVYKDSFYCFGCGAHGDVITFIEKFNKLDFKEAVKFLGDKYNIELPEYKPEISKDGRKTVNCPTLAESIMADYHFKTLKDSDEILFYSDGIYVYGAKSFIAGEVNKRLGFLYSEHRKNEVIGYIKAATYIDRNRFNNNKNLINLKNGLLDINSKKLHPHTHEVLSTIRIPLTFDIFTPSSGFGKIESFLYEVLDLGDIAIIQELLGYLLIPDYRYQRAFLFCGNGRNGKSTLINLIQYFLGKENCAYESLQNLTTDKFAIANLYGKLANIFSDLPANKIYDTSIFKILCGNDAIKGEQKFKDSFSFYNTARLIFATNKPPQIDDDSIAFWRRWIVINFPRTFTEREANHNLLEELTKPDELSEMLNFALIGLDRLLEQNDFSYNKNLDEVADDYNKKSNTVFAFISEACIDNNDYIISKSDLYEKYINYCSKNKLSPINFNFFCKSAKNIRPNLKIIKKQTDGEQIRCWKGLQPV